jgi:hypothetical protein
MLNLNCGEVPGSPLIYRPGVLDRPGSSCGGVFPPGDGAGRAESWGAAYLVLARPAAASGPDRRRPRPTAGRSHGPRRPATRTPARVRVV